jgi:hypothetical protein
MAPADANHIIGSDSIITKVVYGLNRIEYATFEARGNDVLRLAFLPRSVIASGKKLSSKDWTYGEYRGVPGVLRIHRDMAQNVVISAE